MYEGFVHFLFADWHKRRNYVNCSDAVNDSQIENEIDSSAGYKSVQKGLHDTKIGHNPFSNKQNEITEFKAGDNLSAGNIDYSSDSSSRLHCSDITYREWQKVQREVDGAFMNAGNRTKTKVMALQLEIRNALHLDGNIDSTKLVCDDEGSYSKIDEAFHSIVANYRKSFTPLKGNFNPVKRSLVIPNRHVRARQPNKRLMPMSERICTGIKRAKKIKPTCGFCREENHRISTCPKKEKLKTLGEEFVLYNDATAKYQRQHLIEQLEKCRNVSRWDYGTNAHEDIDISRGYKHIIIHQSFSFVDCFTEPRLNIRSMFFRIGFLDGSGNEIEEDGAMFFFWGGCRTIFVQCYKKKSTGKGFCLRQM